MLKIKLAIFCINLVSVLAFASFHTDNCQETQVRINEVPMPRQNLVVTPWEGRAGTWATDSYIFEIGKVVRNGTQRLIAVNVIDPLTFEIVKSGGVAIRANGTRASGVLADLRVGAKGKRADDTFIILRTFREEIAGQPTNRNLFVVTVRTLRKVKVCEETHHELLRQGPTFQ